MDAFPISIPRTENGIRELRTQLLNWQYSASESLQDADLQLGERYTELRDPFPHVVEERVEAVPLAANFRVPRFPAADERRSALRIARPVSTGIGSGFAQVYAARFLPEAPGDTDIIVKIIQSSYSTGFTELYNDGSLDPREWEMQLLSFRVEAWAYSRLAHLQGSIVPYIHGFFKVTLPHGEDAIALVMEEIHGTQNLPLSGDYHGSSEALETVASERRSPLGAVMTLQQLDRLLSAAQNLVSAGVVPADVDTRHVIWPPLSDSGVLEYPVFLDFNLLATPSSHQRGSQLTCHVRLLQDYRFEDELVSDWIRVNIVAGSKTARWFQVPPHEMERSSMILLYYFKGII